MRALLAAVLLAGCGGPSGEPAPRGACMAEATSAEAVGLPVIGIVCRSREGYVCVQAPGPKRLGETDGGVQLLLVPDCDACAGSGTRAFGIHCVAPPPPGDMSSIHIGD